MTATTTADILAAMQLIEGWWCTAYDGGTVVQCVVVMNREGE